MVKKPQKAELVLECDSGCPARQTFSANTLSECFRDAREAGWSIRRQELVGSIKIDDFRQRLCVCPGCKEQRKKPYPP